MPNATDRIATVILKVSLITGLFLPLSTISLANPAIGKGWVIENKMGKQLLHPSCFVTEWISSDNFEEFEQAFGINREDFRQFPGRSFGVEVTNYHPIKPSWNNNGIVSHETISLIQAVQTCSPRAFKHLIDNDGSIYTSAETSLGKLEQRYKLISSTSVKDCSDLAPNIGSQCLQAFQVEIGEYSGGSMGWDMRRGIYGLFKLKELGLSIVPLKFGP